MRRTAGTLLVLLAVIFAAGTVQAQVTFELNDGVTMEVNSGVTVQVEDNTTIDVNGAILDLNGTSGSGVTFNTSTGTKFYSLTVASASAGGSGTRGEIDAEYTTFQYLDTNGLQVEAGTTISNLTTCTFSDGESGGIYLNLFPASNRPVGTDATYWPVGITDVTFNSGPATNVKAGSSTPTLKFYGCAGTLNGESYEIDPYDRIYWVSDASGSTGGMVEVAGGALDGNHYTTVQDAIDAIGALGGTFSVIANTSVPVVENLTMPSSNSGTINFEKLIFAPMEGVALTGSANWTANLKNCVVASGGLSEGAGTINTYNTTVCRYNTTVHTALQTLDVTTKENTITEAGSTTAADGSGNMNLSTANTSTYFWDKASFDFHLTPNATNALDGGVASSVGITDDIDGNARDDGNLDVGADERPANDPLAGVWPSTGRYGGINFNFEFFGKWSGSFYPHMIFSTGGGGTVDAQFAASGTSDKSTSNALVVIRGDSSDGTTNAVSYVVEADSPNSKESGPCDVAGAYYHGGNQDIVVYQAVDRASVAGGDGTPNELLRVVVDQMNSDAGPVPDATVWETDASDGAQDGYRTYSGNGVISQILPIQVNGNSNRCVLLMAGTQLYGLSGDDGDWYSSWTAPVEAAAGSENFHTRGIGVSSKNSAVYMGINNGGTDSKVDLEKIILTTGASGGTQTLQLNGSTDTSVGNYAPAVFTAKSLGAGSEHFYVPSNDGYAFRIPANTMNPAQSAWTNAHGDDLGSTPHTQMIALTSWQYIIAGVDGAGQDSRKLVKFKKSDGSLEAWSDTSGTENIKGRIALRYQVWGNFIYFATDQGYVYAINRSSGAIADGWPRLLSGQTITGMSVFPGGSGHNGILVCTREGKIFLMSFAS